jgi:DNA-binding transcriptional regulator PaaX
MVRAKAPTSSITLVEGQPVHPNRDADLVMAAWDFEAINRNYGEVLERAEQGMELASLPDLPPAAFRHWLAAERTTWALAVAEDPFLPEVLLPEGYLGKEAWTRRQAVHAAIGKRQRVS